MAVNTNLFVIDASAIISLLIPDESPPPELLELQVSITQNRIKLNAPTLIDYEITNAMHLAVIRKRFSSNTAIKYLDSYFRLQIQKHEPNFNSAFFLAQKHKLSVYDAAYLELSNSLNAPLFTLDKQLSRIAKS